MARITAKSRLQLDTLRSIDGYEFWDLYPNLEIPEQPDDTFYPVKSTDRIDSIAYRFYGDPTLWYVIAFANDMELLPADLNVGEVIRVPSARFVFDVLFKIRRR